MATKKKKSKTKIGAQGPQSYWLDMSPAERARIKSYIKEGTQGYIRPDGVKIPGARQIYKDLTPDDGVDLRHIERWSKAKLLKVTKRIRQVATLVSRPFQTITPRSKKQRRAAQKFTGQDLPEQKTMIVPVQLAKHDRVTFRNNQVTIEREFAGGSKTIKQRFLFSDYVDEKPITFLQMRDATQKMLADMPALYRKQDVYYTLLSSRYGPIGESVLKKRLLELLQNYHYEYEVTKQHEGFAEDILGFQMIGTHVVRDKYQIARDHNRERLRQLKKLRFSKRARTTGRR